jgi:hypothetical protein
MLQLAWFFTGLSTCKPAKSLRASNVCGEAANRSASSSMLLPSLPQRLPLPLVHAFRLGVRTAFLKDLELLNNCVTDTNDAGALATLPWSLGARP